MPGFGFTVIPESRQYEYTFDNLAKTIEAFTNALSLEKYAIYIFDYGAPTGLRYVFFLISPYSPNSEDINSIDWQ